MLKKVKSNQRGKFKPGKTHIYETGMRERGQDEHTSLRGDMTKAKGRRKQYIQRRIRLGENSGEIQREKIKDSKLNSKQGTQDKRLSK